MWEDSDGFCTELVSKTWSVKRMLLILQIPSDRNIRFGENPLDNMAIDLTPIIRPWFHSRAVRAEKSAANGAESQRRVLRYLLREGAKTEYGRKYSFSRILSAPDPAGVFSERVPLCQYEDIRPAVMRMVKGEHDVLWPGVCRNFAQSSGTSGGRSKYIPVTRRSLSHNHYAGAACPVAFYLECRPESRLFSGKGFILGGSFESQLKAPDPRVRIGDLSATLIERINPLANMVRIPSKKVALMPDWETKLPALVKASMNADVTNISGVPSWFLTVIRKVIETRGVNKISDVWPNLEVFFHGGISFEPYREEYRKLTDPDKMHFIECYNASEGFFAAQNSLDDTSMLLITDADVYYEFLPLGGDRTVPIEGVEKGKVYELVISASNGLWRYRLGDTVSIESTDPVKIRVAGRTKSFINAFGEELMEDNAERAVAEACRTTGASIVNYTVAPVFAKGVRRGRHQWLIEWEKKPSDMDRFRDILDAELRNLNSDYDAKRNHTIFLDPPEILTARQGLFDLWLKTAGNHKLGGQRKVPRLSNNRDIMDLLLSLANQ